MIAKGTSGWAWWGVRATMKAAVVALLMFHVLAASTDAGAASAPEKTYPACHIENQARIAFQEVGAADTVRVTIDGVPCYKANLVIQIIGATGTALYTYSAPFKRHTAVDWEDPSLPQVASELARSIVQPESKRTSKDLPPWQPAKQYYDQTSESIRVPQARYESLRREDRPLFSHPTHYEAWKVLYYDSQRNVAATILTGGV